MAKALFRFLRGELNGYYLTNIQETMNVTSKEIKDFFTKFRAQQFKAGQIEDNTIYNLGRFAGVSLLRTSSTDSSISIRMSPSHILNGEEVSEKGLFNINTESFDWSEADYTGDMNDKATERRRSSLVGNETVKGYIYEGDTNIFDENGNVISYHEAPPEDRNVAYSDFYGNEFLMLAEGASTYATLSAEIYLEFIKIMQIVRYNGTSVESLCKLIGIICGNELVKIETINTVDANHINIYYKYNDDIEIEYKQQRMSLLTYLVDVKFPQVKFVEIL